MGTQMSRCVILSAGPVNDAQALRPYLREDDWFIAADGGLRLAKALGVRPKILVADFDSMAEDKAAGAADEVVRLPVEKDWTDTMAAAMLALEQGCREFLLLGCTGGRLDHTMANIAVLLYLQQHGADAWLRDGQNSLRLYFPGNYRIPVQADCHFSLIPYGGEVRGITLKNAKYPLEDAVLEMNSTLGISNEFTDFPLEILFREGVLMFFLSKD